MEAAILDGGTRNEPIAVAPIARIERGYATPAAVDLQCITVCTQYTSCTKYTACIHVRALCRIANRPQLTGVAYPRSILAIGATAIGSLRVPPSKMAASMIKMAASPIGDKEFQIRSRTATSL